MTREQNERYGQIRIIQVISAVGLAFGGPAVGSVALNRELNKLGAEALLVSTTLRDEAGATLSRSESRRVAGAGTRLALTPPTRPYSLQLSLRMVAVLARHSKSVDLIHIHGVYVLSAAFAYVIARARGIPYGIQPHGSLEPYQRNTSRIKKKVFDAIFGRRMILNASYVLFASASEAERASDVVGPDQSVIRPLGSSLAEPVRPIGRGTDAWLTSVGRESRFLFLGRLATKKRPDALIRAWAKARITGGQLVIAGSDGDISARDLVELAEGLGVSESVVVVGEVDASEKTWLYQNSATFVLPSENENFGLTVVEAMLGGCHVICSAEVATSSFVRAAQAGEVIRVNEDELARSLSSAANRPDEVKRAGLRAHRFASANLTWEPLAGFLISRASDAR